MSATTILRCTCKSEYQDVRYGTGLRVHNATDTKKKPKSPPWRCTVCSTERS